MFMIIGDTRENIGCTKKSVLVDVGGIKSSIGSQYISNDEFLEVCVVSLNMFLSFNERALLSSCCVLD